eukprot:jgi/Botrbrau1/5836/Bobra.0366s0018.2
MTTYESRVWRKRWQSSVRKALNLYRAATRQWEEAISKGGRAAEDLCNSYTEAQIVRSASLKNFQDFEGLLQALLDKVAEKRQTAFSNLQESERLLLDAVKKLSETASLVQDEPDYDVFKDVAIFGSLTAPFIGRMFKRIWSVYNQELELKCKVIQGLTPIAGCWDTTASLSQGQGPTPLKLEEMQVYLTAWKLSVYVDDDDIGEMIQLLGSDMHGV